MLAYSLADYYQARNDTTLSQFYFKKAQALSDPKRYSSNQSTIAAIIGPLNWRLFKYQLLNGDIAQASKSLEQSLTAYALTSSQDPTALLFEQNVIYDSIIMLINLNDPKSLSCWDVINDRFVKSALTAEQRLTLVTKIFDLLTEQLKDNKFIHPEVLHKVSLIIRAVPYDKINDTQKFYFAKILQNFALKLDKLDSPLSSELFTASNGLLEKIKEKNPALPVMKNMNDRFLKFFTDMVNFESEFLKSECPKNYEEFLSIFTKVFRINTDPTFVKNLIRFKYKPQVIGEIGGLLEPYYHNATNPNDDFSNLAISQIPITKLTDKSLQKIQNDTDKFWSILQLTNNFKDLKRLHNAMYNMIKALSSIKIPSADPAKVKQAVYYFIEKLNAIEVAMFLQSSESDRNSFKFNSVYFYAKDIDDISTRILTKSNVSSSIQSIAEKIDRNLIPTIDLIESHPPAKAPLFFYLINLMNKIALGKTLEKAASSLAEAISRTIRVEESNPKNIEDAAAGLVFLSQANIAIFGNFNEADCKFFEQLLTGTKGIYVKMQKMNIPYKKKEILYKGIIDFWFKAIKDAIDKGHSGLAIEAAMFLTSSKIGSSNEYKAAQIGAIIAENLIPYLEKNISSEDMLQKDLPNIASYIKMLLETGEKKLVISMLNSLASQLIKSNYRLAPEIGEKLISLANQLPPNTIHPQIIADLNFLVLRNLMTQPDLKVNRIAIITDECAAYYTSPLSEESHKPHDYLELMRASYNMIAENNKENNKYAAALDCYNGLMELDPDNIKVYVEKANEVLKKLLDITPKISTKVLLLEELIDNYTYLDDEKTAKELYKELFMAKFGLAIQYLEHNNLKSANKICEEILNDVQFSEQSDAYRGEVRSLKIKIDDKQSSQKQSFQQNQLFFTSSASTSKKKKSKSKKTVENEETKTDEFKYAKKDTTKEKGFNVVEVPNFPDGKVGKHVSGKFIAKDNSGFFPVIKKDISDFNKLKKTNFVLYKKLKKAALEGEICREFGQSGIKYLGSDMWEAKVSTKQRLFGKTVERDGKKFIVFDTYSPKGLHR